MASTSPPPAAVDTDAPLFDAVGLSSCDTAQTATPARDHDDATAAEEAAPMADKPPSKPEQSPGTGSRGSTVDPLVKATLPLAQLITREAFRSTCDAVQAYGEANTRRRYGLFGHPQYGTGNLADFPLPSTESISRFHSRCVPATPLFDLACVLADRGQFGFDVMVMAIVVMGRATIGLRLELTAHVTHRLFVAALNVAHKLLWERAYNASNFAKIATISQEEAADSERALVHACEWKMQVWAHDIDVAVTESQRAGEILRSGIIPPPLTWFLPPAEVASPAQPQFGSNPGSTANLNTFVLPSPAPSGVCVVSPIQSTTVGHNPFAGSHHSPAASGSTYGAHGGAGMPNANPFMASSSHSARHRQSPGASGHSAAGAAGGGSHHSMGHGMPSPQHQHHYHNHHHQQHHHHHAHSPQQHFSSRASPSASGASAAGFGAAAAGSGSGTTRLVAMPPPQLHNAPPPQGSAAQHQHQHVVGPGPQQPPQYMAHQHHHHQQQPPPMAGYGGRGGGAPANRGGGAPPGANPFGQLLRQPQTQAGGGGGRGGGANPAAPGQQQPQGVWAFVPPTSSTTKKT